MRRYVYPGGKTAISREEQARWRSSAERRVSLARRFLDAAASPDPHVPAGVAGDERSDSSIEPMKALLDRRTADLVAKEQRRTGEDVSAGRVEELRSEAASRIREVYRQLGSRFSMANLSESGSFTLRAPSMPGSGPDGAASASELVEAIGVIPGHEYLLGYGGPDMFAAAAPTASSYADLVLSVPSLLRRASTIESEAESYAFKRRRDLLGMFASGEIDLDRLVSEDRRMLEEVRERVESEREETFRAASRLPGTTLQYEDVVASLEASVEATRTVLRPIFNSSDSYDVRRSIAEDRVSSQPERKAREDAERYLAKVRALAEDYERGSIDLESLVEFDRSSWEIASTYGKASSFFPEPLARSCVADSDHGNEIGRDLVKVRLARRLEDAAADVYEAPSVWEAAVADELAALTDADVVEYAEDIIESDEHDYAQWWRRHRSDSFRVPGASLVYDEVLPLVEGYVRNMQPPGCTGNASSSRSMASLMASAAISADSSLRRLAGRGEASSAPGRIEGLVHEGSETYDGIQPTPMVIALAPYLDDQDAERLASVMVLREGWQDRSARGLASAYGVSLEVAREHVASAAARLSKATLWSHE